MAEKPLRGLVALVTGAGGGDNGGIGAGIARCLSRAGAAVAINDLDETYALATVQQLQAADGEALTMVGDVADSARVCAMVRAVMERYGRLDILVNNAVIMGHVPAVERMPSEVWLRTIAVDLTGPFYLCRAVLPHMLARRYGRIINMSSFAGVRTGFMSGAPYTAAKSGIMGLTRHLSAEVAPFGITVNAILPAGVLTPRFRQKSAPERLAAMGASYPTGRMGDPEDIGRTVVFLADPASGQINGAGIPVHGGMGGLYGDFSQYKALTGKDSG